MPTARWVGAKSGGFRCMFAGYKFPFETGRLKSLYGDHAGYVKQVSASASALIEQSAQWVQQCIIDPEGDFVTLSDQFGHVVVDGERTEAELTGIANRIRQHRVSCVLTLEGLDIEQQMRAAAAFLNGMFDADREYWYPVLVVVDEAQMFAPSVGGDVSEDARKASLGAMTNLMCRGRKRGLAGVIATQRLAKLAKNVAAEASNFLMGRTFLDIDMARAADLLGMDRRQAEMFRDLKRGHFVALGPALSRRPLPVDDRQCRDLGALVQPEADAAAGCAAGCGRPDLHARPGRIHSGRSYAVRRRHRARPPISLPNCRARRQQPRRCRLPSRVWPSRKCRRKSVRSGLPACSPKSSTIRAPASGPDAVLYQDFLVRLPHAPRARIRRCRCRNSAAGWRLSRSGVDAETAAGEAWATALSLSIGVTDDLQGVFLMMAKAAIGGEPCPSDARDRPCLRHPFGPARPPPARLFRGAGAHRRAHGFQRQAHRCLSGPAGRDRTGLGRCA